jgi:membrane associated rhomboid family serine protease
LKYSTVRVTKILVFTSVLLFFTAFILDSIGYDFLYKWLILTPMNLYIKPWTLFTFPLIEISIISILFNSVWLWLIGYSLEQTIGGRKFALLVLVTSITAGLAMSFAGLAVKQLSSLDLTEFPICGWGYPLIGLTWAWALFYPHLEVLLLGVLPIKARWLAWMVTILTFFIFFRIHWLLAFASISSIPVTYLFIIKRQTWAKLFGFSFRKQYEERRRQKQRRKLRVLH